MAVGVHVVTDSVPLHVPSFFICVHLRLKFVLISIHLRSEFVPISVDPQLRGAIDYDIRQKYTYRNPVGNICDADLLIRMVPEQSADRYWERQLGGD